VAGALKAKRLLLLTDVAGILNPAKELLPSLSMSEAEKLQLDGVISGGMLPKVNCAFEALRAGVERVTIVDGRIENCVLLELLTDQGIGTQIIP
jgi:acetylglutamate kinase